MEVRVYQKAEFFIGSEFITPKVGVLKVVEIVGKNKWGDALFGCHCSICHEVDPELYSELFFSTASDLKNGKIPCGCAKTPHHTERQNIIRVTRKTKEKNITFNGWANEYQGVMKTKCDLSCEICGYQWKTTSIRELIKNNNGCSSCAPSGYDPSKSGTFYVVEWTNIDGIKWIKYGI